VLNAAFVGRVLVRRFSSREYQPKAASDLAELGQVRECTGRIAAVEGGFGPGYIKLKTFYCGGNLGVQGKEANSLGAETKRQ
jgi:hypothetical protein